MTKYTGEERRRPGEGYCTKHQAMEVARETAHATVQEVFQTMGVNVTDTDHVIQAQVDFAYLRRARKSAESMQAHAKKLVIGLTVAGIASAVWAALTFKGGGNG